MFIDTRAEAAAAAAAGACDMSRARQRKSASLAKSHPHCAVPNLREIPLTAYKET